MSSSPEASGLKRLGKLQYSDEESRTHGDESNLNDSLNNTMSGGGVGGPVVPQKRKYQKRKKPDSTEPTVTDPISKVEGTKLIIQKKAIKMALASAADLPKKNVEEDSSVSIESSSPVKKKYRVSKKQLKETGALNASSLESSLMVVNAVIDDSENRAVAPKLKITKKQTSSIVLHIPKEKLSLSSSGEALGHAG